MATKYIVDNVSIKESLMGSYTENQIKEIVDFFKSKPITEEEKQ
jgi:hypothetical protein